MNIRFVCLSLLIASCSSAPTPKAGEGPVTRYDFCPRFVSKLEACIDQPEFKDGLLAGALRSLAGVPANQLGTLESYATEQRESFRQTFLQSKFKLECPGEMTRGGLTEERFNYVAPTITDSCEAFGEGILLMVHGIQEHQFSG